MKYDVKKEIVKVELSNEKYKEKLLKKISVAFAIYLAIGFFSAISIYVICESMRLALIMYLFISTPLAVATTIITDAKFTKTSTKQFVEIQQHVKLNKNKK